MKDAKQNTAESTLKERDVERFTSLCIPSAKETGVIVKTEQSNNDCHTDSPLSNPVLACPRVSSINSSASLPGLSYSRDSAISVQLESSNVDTIKSVAPAQFLPSGLEGTEESISIAKDPEPKIDDTESHRSKNAMFVVYSFMCETVFFFIFFLDFVDIGTEERVTLVVEQIWYSFPFLGRRWPDEEKRFAKESSSIREILRLKDPPNFLDVPQSS